MTTAVKILALLGALFLFVVAFLALAQTWLLFPRLAIQGAAPPLPAAAERITVHLPSGDLLAGVRLPAVATPPATAPLILGFGGNAWNAEALALYLHGVIPDRDVVAFHYRGYTPSTGRPSAQALLSDALSVHDHLAATLEPAAILPVGLSIGAGPAAHLAAGRPVAGVILVTAFDSLTELAREHYPWAPVRLLLRHRMDVAEALQRADAPVALISAERDTIVPGRRTAPLRAAARDVVLDRQIAGAGHNDLYDRPEFAAAMREALARIEASGRGGGAQGAR